MRRKKKAVHKTATTDDKKLQSTLKRLNVNSIPGIDEVNIFRSDMSVLHFQSPKVQASITANTYVVVGTPQSRKVEEMLPSIITQLGQENLLKLQGMAQAQLNKAGVNPEQVVGQLPKVSTNL